MLSNLVEVVDHNILVVEEELTPLEVGRSHEGVGPEGVELELVGPEGVGPEC